MYARGLNTLLNALQTAFIALWSSGWIVIALLLRVLTGDPQLPLRMARSVWAPGVLLAKGARLDVSGLGRVDFDRPCLFVVNHRSLIDIPVLFRSLPVLLRFVVKSELRKAPFLGWFLTATEMVMVDRTDRAQSVSAMGVVADLLRTGKSVVTFPEGSRGQGGVGRFSPLALSPAIEAGATVVPIAIKGAGRVVPPGSFLTGRGGVIQVSIGHPIDTGDLTRTDRKTLAINVQQQVEAMFKD